MILETKKQKQENSLQTYLFLIRNIAGGFAFAGAL